MAASFYLPYVGDPLAPVKDKKYVRGLHRLGDRWFSLPKGSATYGCVSIAARK